VFFVLALLLIYGSIKEKRLFDMQVLMWRLKNWRKGRKEIPDEVVY